MGSRDPSPSLCNVNMFYIIQCTCRVWNSKLSPYPSPCRTRDVITFWKWMDRPDQWRQQYVTWIRLNTISEKMLILYALNSNCDLFSCLNWKFHKLIQDSQGAPEHVYRISGGQSGPVECQTNHVAQRSNQVSTGQRSSANDMPVYW